MVRATVSHNSDTNQEGSQAVSAEMGSAGGLGRFAGQFAKTSVPFEVILPDGAVRRFGEGMPSFRVTLKNRQAMRAISSVDEGRIGDAYLAGDIDIDGDEFRWFNTAAFANPPDDRRGTATVGQIEGPPFKQMDVSIRKNFRFGGR